MTTFFEDGFTDTDGTALESHTPDVGTGWTKIDSGTSPTVQSNELVGSGVAEFLLFLADDPAPSLPCFVQIDDLGARARFRVVVCASADGADGYIMTWTTAPGAGQYQITKRVAGDNNAGFLGQFELAGQTSFRVAASLDGSGGVDLDLYAGTAGSPLTLLGTINDAVSAFTTNLHVGLIAFGAGADHADNFIAGTGSSPGITPSAISISETPSDPTHVRLTATAASGGTGDLSYQWYRSTVPGFTPDVGTELSGETSLDLVDTPPDSAMYYYRIRATDEAAATADSATFGASYWLEPLVIGFAGDSNYHAPPGDGTENPPTIITRLLGDIAGPRSVVGVEMAVSGSNSSQWMQGQTDYTAAAAAFDSAGVTKVVFMVGTNDAGSTSAATFQSNVQDAVDGWRALDYDVFLAWQIPIQAPADQTRNQALLEYQDALAVIAAGEPDHVKVIGQDSWEVMWPRPDFYNLSPGSTPGIHILTLGVEALAGIHARDIAEIIEPSASGVAGGSFAWVG